MTHVWVTGEGDCYHSSPDCIGLTSGQEGGAVQNYTLHPPVRMELSKALAKRKKPCGTCGGTTL
ncbi:hypothetical protein DMB42_11670 [Nonomuraea sp. WAC 01424]|uniref:hypothetical protein n=1 Tax=Nonomuraea sp. WAC 01424 TaxID=2203200 RepID=UPI000F7A234F|nr:hypothetical protein [Nonomuraea sp. WAC 01424]RSN12829.1 hypothetical protein DMB42_11670 [Nonomuraea sp. WAC 01424]